MEKGEKEMPDREKVINGLREMSCRATWKDVDRIRHEFQPIINDALALLKEQEAKQAIKQTYHVMMNRDYENPVVVTRYDWLCPTCKSLLYRDIDVIDDNYHFCKVCGQAVKWE